MPAIPRPGIVSCGPAGNTEVASGWGKFMVLDNDVFGIAEGDNNANTWQ